MSNEFLIIASLIAIFSAGVFLFAFLREQGLYAWTVVASIAANIEVLILVRAFGMYMTLGNILFASTFLVTDILSELYGKKSAQKAVIAGMIGTIGFTAVSSSWLLYSAAPQCQTFGAVQTLFSSTPRVMLSSISVYVIVQFWDVWFYHKLWAFTEKICGSKRRFLWLRNNVSTLTSQLINTVLFNILAFWEIFDVSTLVSVIISGYLIFVVTSLADTPFIYLARKIHEKGRFEI